jgi:hypothetical protein
MAPRTNGGLAHGMAHNGRICHKNYEFTSVKGPAPTSAFSHVLNLHSRDLDPTAYVEQALRTALSGNILEFTCIWGASTLSPLARTKSST